MTVWYWVIEFSFGDEAGTKLFCWRLTIRERLKLLFTGNLWQYMMTFNQPQQPQHLTTERPNISVTTGEPDNL